MDAGDEESTHGEGDTSVGLIETFGMLLAHSIYSFFLLKCLKLLFSLFNEPDTTGSRHKKTIL